MTDPRVLRRKILKTLQAHHLNTGGAWMPDEELLIALGDENVAVTIETLASALIYLRDCEVRLPNGDHSQGYLELKVKRAPSGDLGFSRIKPAGLDLLDPRSVLADPRISEF